MLYHHAGVRPPGHSYGRMDLEHVHHAGWCPAGALDVQTKQKLPRTRTYPYTAGRGPGTAVAWLADAGVPPR